MGLGPTLLATDAKETALPLVEAAVNVVRGRTTDARLAMIANKVDDI